MNDVGYLQLVIPMAGLGTRFIAAGYETPKPLLTIHGLPMYRLVLANLMSSKVRKVVLVAQASWGLATEVDLLAGRLGVEIELIEIDYLTGGPADTVELTFPHLDPDWPVICGNSDQFVDADLDAFYAQLEQPDVDGNILTMRDDDPRWSYVEMDTSGDVLRVREKEVISSFATVGIYGFATASLMRVAFEGMRKAEDHVNGEYYVAPSYNFLIAAQHRIVTYDLGPLATVMHGLGIPTDYERFVRNPVSRRAVTNARSLWA